MENDTKKNIEQPREPQSASEQELDEAFVPIPLKYKALAAVALIVPFGFMIDWGQTLFLSMNWEYVSKMFVLAGLIIYIVAVGKAARKIQEYHEGKRS